MSLATTGTAKPSGSLVRLHRIPLAALALIFVLILFLRHPGGILHANFWAEDGWNWYPDAYAKGFLCLVLPHSGYLQTISRLGGLVAQPAPVLWAPTIFAIIALAVQTLPALLLLSRRFDAAWPSYWSRLIFALVYLALPSSFETFGNLTNSQWYLAILAFLIVAGAPPRSVAGRVADSVALIVGGLSGPFSLLLLPIALLSWWRERGADRLLRVALVLLTVVIQVGMMATTMGQARPISTLGVGVGNLAHIVTMKVAYGLLLGSRVMVRLAHGTVWTSDLAVSVIATAVAVVLILAWWRGSPLFRRFAAFGGLVAAAALASPVVTGTPAWVVLASPGAGQRYFLIPMLVMAAAFFTLAADRQVWLSRLGFLLCAGLAVGVLGDFPFPHMRQTDFDSVARTFAAAPAGTRTSFPILPDGTIPMVLVKK